jgi:hypothetical protein
LRAMLTRNPLSVSARYQRIVADTVSSARSMSLLATIA